MLQSGTNTPEFNCSVRELLSASVRTKAKVQVLQPEVKIVIRCIRERRDCCLSSDVVTG